MNSISLPIIRINCDKKASPLGPVTGTQWPLTKSLLVRGHNDLIVFKSAHFKNWELEK